MSVAVVTGANRGIGLGFIRAISQRGDRVVAGVRNLNDLGDLEPVASDQVLVRQLDVTSDSSTMTFGKELPEKVNLLINNAGWGPDEYIQSLTDSTSDDTLKMFDVNAMGPLRVTKSLLSNLEEDAVIVNISSRLSSLTNATKLNDPGYAMSKAALNMLTRQMAGADELAGCIVISISPGWVRTRMGGQNATLSVEESVASMLKVVDGLEKSDSGSFFNFDGSTFPW